MTDTNRPVCAAETGRRCTVYGTASVNPHLLHQAWKNFPENFWVFLMKPPSQLSPVKKEAVLLICNTNQVECRGASIKRPYPQLALTSSSWSCCAKQSPSHHIRPDRVWTYSLSLSLRSLLAAFLLSPVMVKIKTHLWKQADESPGMRTSAALSRHAVGLKWTTLLVRLIEVVSVSSYINTLQCCVALVLLTLAPSVLWHCQCQMLKERKSRAWHMWRRWSEGWGRSD